MTFIGLLFFCMLMNVLTGKITAECTPVSFFKQPEIFGY